MKEKKLYKIAFMGDKDHGCDIISTLESWGGSNYYPRTGSDPEYVYFINDLGTIDFIHNSEMLSEEMKNFYFMFWHDYNIECHLKVGETINYGGQDYDVDSILFDANNRCIVYKLKSFGIGVEYITNNELTPTEEYQTEEENNEYLCKNNMKRKLAIKGHPTRGDEVIEILKMLGGKNKCDSPADNLGLCYLIDDEFDICAHYFGYDDYEDGGLNIFTLEEFLEKYPYKVGDKIIDIADGDSGIITVMKWDEDVSDMKYHIAFDNGDMGWYTNDTIKFLKKDEKLKKGKAWNALDLVEKHYDEHCDDMYKTMFMIGPVMVPDKVDDKLEYNIIDGYEFDKVENGKIILKPIKPKYPTTYEDCCKVLGISYRAQLSYTNPDVERGNIYLTKEKHLLDAFMKLRICRNAYWKIAGEDMRLDKPWEPKSTEMSHAIVCRDDGDFLLHRRTRAILIFPTEEMRDAFYENFKDLIEQCKELL